MSMTSLCPTPTPLQLGRYEEAIADYSRSLALDPRNIKTLNNRGYSYAKSGNYDAGAGGGGGVGGGGHDQRGNAPLSLRSRL